MYKTFVIVDLEVVVQTYMLNEIVEFGAIKIEEDSQTKEIKIIDEFRSFVKPMFHKRLPNSFKKITGISLEDLQDSPIFEDVCNRFRNWAGEDVLFIGWGKQDCLWIRQNCLTYNIPYFWFTQNYLDFQQLYQQQIKHKGNMLGLQEAVRMECLEQEKTVHRALEDSKSCSKVFMKIFPEIRNAIVFG